MALAACEICFTNIKNAKKFSKKRCRIWYPATFLKSTDLSHEISALFQIKFLLFLEELFHINQTTFFSICLQRFYIRISIGILYHHRHDPILKTLPEKKQSARPPVPILKRMDALISCMKFCQYGDIHLLITIPAY